MITLAGIIYSLASATTAVRTINGGYYAGLSHMVIEWEKQEAGQPYRLSRKDSDGTYTVVFDPEKQELGICTKGLDESSRTELIKLLEYNKALTSRDDQNPQCDLWVSLAAMLRV